MLLSALLVMLLPVGLVWGRPHGSIMQRPFTSVNAPTLPVLHTADKVGEINEEARTAKRVDRVYKDREKDDSASGPLPTENRKSTHITVKDLVPA